MTLYDQSIPTLLKYLGVMDHILNKGEAWCKEKGVKEEELLESRLIDDMRPLPFQVQAISNTAKFVAQRIGGVEPQVWEDKETTFPELHARIAKTIDLLKSLDRKTFEGKESQEILMKTSYGEFPFETGQRYISEYAIPNFHFHLSTAYCILRHKGVPVGAMDYLKGVFPSLENKTN